MDRSDPEYSEAVRFLYDRINYEKSFDRPYNQNTYRLARMVHLLEDLGNPHLAAPVIHIAGTKGKGSVAWLIAEMLRRSGLRTGLYTSPHLQFLEERFVVDGLPCPIDQVTSQIRKLQESAKRTEDSPHGPPTFFEITTALAWSLFRENKTQVNVIEVGLGGRLDSTNVCSSSLSIITSISYDHQQQLGNTLALIAGEKAGIIKPGVPLIHGARNVEARDVIRSVAVDKDSEVWELGRDFDCQVRPRILEQNSYASDIEFLSRNRDLPLQSMTGLKLKMPGVHQGDNAALVIAAWHRLRADGWAVTEAALRDALEFTQLPSRIEVISEKPTLVLDTAHNIASIAALLRSLEDHFQSEKRTVIFGCSKDKEYEAMLEQIQKFTDRLIVTQFHTNPRAVPVERLEELAREMSQRLSNEGQPVRCTEIYSAPDIRVALDFAKGRTVPAELICITGSFFLAAEAREVMQVGS